MSRISNKVLIGLAGGAAALSLIGVAGATYTDIASAGGSYSVAHAAVTLTDTYGKIVSDQSSFNPQAWSWLATPTKISHFGSTGFTLYKANNGGNDAPVDNPLGSDTQSVANFTIDKTASSAQLNSLALTASVVSPDSQLVRQSSISILMRNPASGIGDQIVYSGTLSDFLAAADPTGPGFDVAKALGGTTPAAIDFLKQINSYQQGGSGGTDNGAVFAMSVSPTAATGYTNAATDQTLSLTVNAIVAG